MATMVAHRCACGRFAQGFVSKVTLARLFGLDEEMMRQQDQPEVLDGDLDHLAELGDGLGVQMVTTEGPFECDRCGAIHDAPRALREQIEKDKAIETIRATGLVGLSSGPLEQEQQLRPQSSLSSCSLSGHCHGIDPTWVAASV